MNLYNPYIPTFTCANSNDAGSRAKETQSRAACSRNDHGEAKALSALSELLAPAPQDADCAEAA